MRASAYLVGIKNNGVMMKHLTKCKLAFVIAAAVGIAGCGSDGKDGNPGEPGPGPTPPTTETSEITNVDVIHHAVEDGQVTVEFGITNEDDIRIIGLEDAELYLAALTEQGIKRSNSSDENPVGGAAKASDEGASLTELENGNYEFIAPMAAVTAGTEGIIRFQVGGGDIATSDYIVIDKPEAAMTTSTEACYTCHVDYSTSSFRHPSRVAVDLEGETDFVAGCMTCHGHVTRDDNGSNTHMQKIGHINHQGFETGFEVSNCTTCHVDPITTVYNQQTCIDCHDAAGVANTEVEATFNSFNQTGDDWRQFHTVMTERKELKEEHVVSASAPYFVQGEESGEWCSDISLHDVEENQLNLGELVDAGTVSVSSYLHGYYEASITGRAASMSVSTSGESMALCGTLDESFVGSELFASARITFDGLVSMTAHSDIVSAEGAFIHEFDRRHSVTADSCTSCHNSEGDYHKGGTFDEGGIGCIACHNNGQDRNAKSSAPGFGPMVHSMHWGEGSDAVTGEPNSATKLNAENCVACHADGIDLYEVPNAYIKSKAFNGGEAGVMTSPVMANCFACHNDEKAQSHMEQNGGELNVPVTADWHTQPTSESCATCHAEGKSFGIEKFHIFER
ncbi:hypothetical protein L2737_20860 [Shewanella electrodiphila]|uniref:Uncharacterized protein n=1 Tax=Shewanella electrodiphila TaxID=934143 RepID=A0ABT0KV88_9GAMM|nr:hypothetical protein [Shewanella electrodiphila]MCL1047755.1 hypothetical protein [Shewanella electrodiphila]